MPFENVSCQGRIPKFFQGGHQFSSLFSSVFFPAELILSDLSAKNDSRRSGGMLPRKIFENLHAAITISVLFEQVLRKVCLIFGP